jgi:hypothetical protein
MKAIARNMVIGGIVMGSLLLPLGVAEAKTTKPQPSYGNATAICRDGTLSYSQHRRGTCSWHKGVRQWLRSVPA